MIIKSQWVPPRAVKTTSAGAGLLLVAFWAVVLWSAGAWAGGGAGTGTGAPAALRYEIIAEQPHDSATFTQGLIVDDDALVETSGLYGQSFLARYPIAGEGPVQRLPLPADVFAEGLARVGDVYWVLTWQERRALRFAVEDLAPLPAASYAGEGWGLTYDGHHLIVSDGSDQLTFRDASSFAPLRRVAVRAAGRPVSRLNELEFAAGKVWANVWHSPLIMVIDPATGVVVGQLDLTPLVRQHTLRQREAVLNGIAYDATSDSFWITGKLWPKRYQLRVLWPAPAVEAAL